MKNLGLVIMFFALLIGVVYWTKRDATGGGASGSLWSANPAAVACTDAGGTIEVVTDAAGHQSGYCHTSDGSVCEAWGLYRTGSCVTPSGQ